MFKKKRSLSQVFLKDAAPCTAIAESVKELGVTHVLEIGPGLGILTKELLDCGFQVTAVEKDADLISILRVKFIEAVESKQLVIVNQDILSYEIAEDSKIECVVGNIPYMISSPIILWSTRWLKQVKNFFFLTQLEFTQRLVAQPGIKAYGSLSVYTQVQCEASLEFVVDRSLFTPVPKVDSAVVRLKAREEQPDIALLKKMEKLSKHLFKLRRKKLRNTLGAYSAAAESLGIDLNLRCESLPPETFLKLIQAHSNLL